MRWQSRLRIIRFVRCGKGKKMSKTQLVRQKVQELLGQDNTGHGCDHVERVYHTALKLCEGQDADRETVALAALLHDVDDYKLFGAECAESLANARAVMAAAGVDSQQQGKVLDIIRHMGYSKALKGIRPVTAEGRIVSDADMLDAIGAMGIVRTLVYALARCETVVFDRNVWPDLGLSAEEYKKPGRRSDNFINHFFEKLLKIKDLMLTERGRLEAERRHRLMTTFLFGFFEEQGLDDWIAFLRDFECRKPAA